MANARQTKCSWCGRTYAVKDSNADNEEMFCGKRCERDWRDASDECHKWAEEISDAWDKYTDAYVPDEDECNPLYADFLDVDELSKEFYQEFKKRYHVWKRNHCWKRSFWDKDGTADGSSEESGGGDGIGKTIVNIVVFVLIVGAVWSGIKGAWNAISGSGAEDGEEAMLKGWKKHLEQRLEAFGDGLPEREVENKGLGNYTWGEWQAKRRAEIETSRCEKAAAEEKKEKDDGDEGFLSQKAKQIGDQAKQLGNHAKELGNQAKGLWKKITD